MSVLRKLDEMEFDYHFFKKLQVGKVLLPYRKHDDRQVVEKTTKILRKYKRMHDQQQEQKKTQEEAEKKQAAELEAELDDMF